MRDIILGSTNIVTRQNAFGALPIQRDENAVAVKLLRKAFAGGINFFDTARAYSDSEEKIGCAFEGKNRDKMYIATKTAAKTAEAFWTDLHTSLKNLRTDYVDIYQLHCAPKCFTEEDELYRCMQQAKAQGKIKHISITCHKIGVAEECVESGLYETMQFPFSYLSGEREIELVKLCKKKNVGFIAMKGLAGGLITSSKLAYSFIGQFDNVLPIWGIQRENELDEWLSFFEETPIMNASYMSEIEKDKKNFGKSFCRGCGYCMPCQKGIMINQCARMSLMLRRAPSKAWLTDYWQGEMKKIEACINCNACSSKCPYGLDTPQLLKENYSDYFGVLSGEIKL